MLPCLSSVMEAMIDKLLNVDISVNPVGVS